MYYSVVITLFVCTVSLASAKPSCWIDGHCMGTTLDILENIDTKENCLKHCKRNKDCNWFTFTQNNECHFFSECESLDEDADEAISGESTCKYEYSKLFVGVGLGVTGQITNDVEILDLSSSETTCQKIQDFPNYVNEAVGGLDFEERPIICGGFDITSYLRGDCHTFENGSWHQTSPLTERRILASVSPSPYGEDNHKLFVTGGFNGLVRNSTEVLTMDGWQEVGLELPVTAYSHCVTLLNETTAIVIGGYSNGVACSPSTHIFNTESGIWIEGPPLIDGRVDHHCGRILLNPDDEDFTVIVVGGNNGTWMSTVEIFDEVEWKWRPGPELPFGIGAGSLVEEPNGGVILVGGCADSTEYLTSLFHLPHAGDEADWNQMEQELTMGRHGHSAFLVPDDVAKCES